MAGQNSNLTGAKTNGADDFAARERDFATQSQRERELAELAGFWATLSARELALVLTDAKYDHYVAQQRDDVARLRALLATAIPAGFDFRAVAGLSAEVSEKLARFAPRTLAAAANISGITPAALDILQIHLRRAKK